MLQIWKLIFNFPNLFYITILKTKMTLEKFQSHFKEV